MDIRAATPLRILGPSIPTPTRPVSARLRQHRVHNEMEAGRRWEANWGWLAAPTGAGPGGDPASAAAAGPTSSKVATKDSMDRFLASHEGSCTSTIKLSLRAQKQQLQQPQGHYKVTASAGSASSSSLEQPAQAARSGGSGGGDAVLPHRGVAAGCGMACTWAKLAKLDGVDDVVIMIACVIIVRYHASIHVHWRRFAASAITVHFRVHYVYTCTGDALRRTFMRTASTTS